MEEVLIGIGDSFINISLPDLSFQLEPCYLSFLCSLSRPPDGTWQIRHDGFPSTREFPPFQSPPPRWDISRHNDGKIFRIWLQTDPHRPWKTARMEDDCSRGDIWAERREQETISFPLFILDLLLFSHLLLPRKGIIIHAAGAKIDSGAFLFPADAGGGKSTWAKLLAKHPGLTVLGEDKVILRETGNAYHVFGTPWNPRPEFQKADSAPLRGIFFLHHSHKNQIVRLNQSTALQNILQQSFLPFNERDELDRAVSILEEVINKVPAYSFGFRPDHSAVECFQAFIASGL